MAINEPDTSQLSTITSGNSVLDELSNKFVVKPKTLHGINGFVFDYEGEEEVTWAAEITDHFIENNTPVQDHIGVKPLKMTLHGFVAELILKKPQGSILGSLATIQGALTSVPAYLGNYTPGAVQKLQKITTAAQNTVNQIDSAASRLYSLVNLFTAPGSSRQTQAYNKLLALANKRQVMVVQTPWKTLDRMAIESVRFIQDELTHDWTDILVTLKQLQFVSLTTTLDVNANRNAQMAQPAANNGTTAGTPVPTSALYSSFQTLGVIGPTS